MECPNCGRVIEPCELVKHDADCPDCDIVENIVHCGCYYNETGTHQAADLRKQNVTSEDLIDDDGNVMPDKKPKWWGVFLIPVFASLHFVACVALMIFVYPENRRYEVYEYYAPWGWGKAASEEE